MIDRERRKNPRVWEDLADLYKCVLAIEKRKGMQRQEDLRDFLEFEAEQFRPEGSAEKEGRARRRQLVPKEPTTLEAFLDTCRKGPSCAHYEFVDAAERTLVSVTDAFLQRAVQTGTA